MPLRRSPRLTPALLAANRANACRSTGPRSAHGKARAALNALKHGRYAAGLPERLQRARCPEAEAQWHAIRARIAEAFKPTIPAKPAVPTGPTMPDGRPRAGAFQKSIDRMANWVWAARRNWQHTARTKPESTLESVENGTCSVKPSTNWPGIAIRHPWARLGVVFYVQRRRGWRKRQVSVRLWESLGRYPGAGTWKPPDPGPEFESGLRSRIYRLGRPRYWEQIRYCLDRRGCYHPEWRGPYRKLRREMRESGMGAWLEPHPFLALQRQQEANQGGVPNST
jgi:hypothetical protein